MRRYVSARLLLAIVLPSAVIAACADGVPTEPAATAVPLDASPLAARPVDGNYDVEFLWSGGALTLVAHVRDAWNAAPAGGTVTFQYCSLGRPVDDVTRPDEAPSSACETGEGRWVTLSRVPLDAWGDATRWFGPVSVVTVIGFRVVYSPEGSGVARGSVVEDWYRPL